MDPAALVRMVGGLQADVAAARERLGQARAEARENQGTPAVVQTLHRVSWRAST